MIEKDTLREAYESGEGTFKKLAEKYGISEGTIKSWAKQDRDKGQPWTKPTQPKPKNQKTKTEKVESKKVEVEKEKVIPKKVADSIDKELIDKVMENGDLTDKQRLFCIYYIKCFNATKAYQKAYQSSYVVANSEGYKLLVNPCIKDEIDRLKKHRLNRNLLTEDDIFQKMMDIAFADITDYTEFGAEDVPALHPDTRKQLKDENGEPITYKSNYVYFKNSGEVDGSLITEVSQGKDGVKVKLADKMKALQWLGDRMDLLPTAVREKLEMEKVKMGSGGEDVTIVFKGADELED